MKNKYELAIELRNLQNFTYENFKLIKQLGKLIKKHKRLCEAYCNDDVKNFDFKIERLENRIRELKELNPSLHAFSLKFQHDPRGNTVIIGNSVQSLYWVFR